MARRKIAPVVRTSSDTTAELISSEQLPAATPEQSEGNIETPKTINQPSVPTAKISGLRPPIDAAVREAVAQRLRDNPLETHTDIAAQLGVSHDLVSQISRRLNTDDTDLGEKRMRSFQRQIGKELPVSERVRKYAEVVRGQVDAKGAFSVLSALKRIEELEGQVTAKERRESADNVVPKLPAMFVLPGGTDMDIGIAVKVRKR